MKKNLRDAFKEHIEKTELNNEQLDKLQSLFNQKVAPPKQSSTRKTLWFSSASAAIVLFFIGFIFLHSPYSTNEQLFQEIANEVAKNHLKMRPLEVQTQSIDAIQNYFDQLDFLPIRSRHFGLGDQQLLGARYCSIKGVTAAQLRYKGANSNPVTLYETHYETNIFSGLPNIEKGEEPIVAYSKGLKVKMWVEQGVVMVSTTEDMKPNTQD